MNVTHSTKLVCALALMAFSTPTAMAQVSAQIDLPKVEEPKIIGIAYNRKGQGRISAADREGHVRQYMEVWEDKSKIPNVVTYILIGEDRLTFYSVTWGKGPINADAFNCKAIEIPEFDKKTLWVATVADGILTFKVIEDNDVKGLFGNLATARRDWDAEVNSPNQKRNANLTQSNILTFLKKKNREKWLQNGWLQPATTCVRHL